MMVDHKRRQGPPLRFMVEVLAVGLVVVLTLALGPARASALDQAMDAVFTVHSADAEDRFLGSAFLWSDGSLAVTNAHVVGEAEEVRLVDRHGVEAAALVIGRDAARDVAVLSVAAGRRGLKPAPGNPGLGDEVFALGAPLGAAFSLTEGRISALARQVDPAVPLRLLQHDAAVNPGSSGGPLVDAEGRLLGMNSRIADGSRMFVGIAYAIAVADLTRIVTGLVEETLAPLPVLGLQARPVDRKVAAALGGAAGGLLIDGVNPGGLAEAAGLRPGDVLEAVDGGPLAAPGQLAFALERAENAAVLTVRRGKNRLYLRLSLRAEGQLTGQRLREVAGGAPETVASYSLAALGVGLDAQGVVTSVTENSPALFAGLARGDRILAVNGAEVDLSTCVITAPALILVSAPGGATRHIYLDPWGAGDGVRPVGGANVLDPDVVVF